MPTQFLEQSSLALETSSSKFGILGDITHGNGMVVTRESGMITMKNGLKR